MSGEEVQTGSLALDGGTLDYARFGQSERGERPLVLLPGLGLHGVRRTAYAQARMFRPLAERHTVWVLDCREPLPRPCTLPALAADAGRAMDALGIRQADIVGISMGGMIAQYLALDRPGLVGKLVLAATLSRPNDTLRQAARRWRLLAERDDYEGLVRDVMERTYSERFLSRFGELLPKVAMLDRPATLDRFADLARACLACDTYDRLGELRCPVFVIGGRQDRVVTGIAAEETAEKLGCALYMYEQLGHAVWEEASGDFCGRVLDFLQKGV